MELHELISVTATADPNAYVAVVDITDVTGERYEANYSVTPADPFGLAPIIRAAVDQWIADGNLVHPYVPVAAPIPDRVTARQFKLQLLADDLIDGVEAWIATQPRAIQIAYDTRGTFVRDEPMMQAGFAALGFSATQVDEFFTAAAAI